jgi:SAM-dependent methyltransferase
MNYFDTRFRYDPGKVGIWKVLCRYLQKFIPRDSRILDFGAGYCYFINNIQAKEKVAVDVSDVVLKYANRSVKAYRGGIDRRFASGHFDAVFSSNVLEHLTHEEIFEALGQIKRVLKKRGTLLLIVPNFRCSYKMYFDDYTHKTVLTDRSLKDMLLVAGFSEIRIVPRFLPFSTESNMKASPVLLKAYLRMPYRPFAGQMMAVAKKP